MLVAVVAVFVGDGVTCVIPGNTMSRKAVTPSLSLPVCGIEAAVAHQDGRVKVMASDGAVEYVSGGADPAMSGRVSCDGERGWTTATVPRDHAVERGQLRRKPASSLTRTSLTNEMGQTVPSGEVLANSVHPHCQHESIVPMSRSTTRGLFAAAMVVGQGVVIRSGRGAGVGLSLARRMTDGQRANRPNRPGIEASKHRVCCRRRRRSLPGGEEVGLERENTLSRWLCEWIAIGDAAERKFCQLNSSHASSPGPQIIGRSCIRGMRREGAVLRVRCLA